MIGLGFSTKIAPLLSVHSTVASTTRKGIGGLGQHDRGSEHVECSDHMVCVQAAVGERHDDDVVLTVGCHLDERPTSRLYAPHQILSIDSRSFESLLQEGAGGVNADAADEGRGRRAAAIAWFSPLPPATS